VFTTGTDTPGVVTIGVVTTGTALGTETLEVGALHGAHDPLEHAPIPIV